MGYLAGTLPPDWRGARLCQIHCLGGQNRACFPEEKRQNSQKWVKFMKVSFWPFLWFVSPDFPQSEIAATNFYDSGRSLGEELGKIFCAFSCFIGCTE